MSTSTTSTNSSASGVASSSALLSSSLDGRISSSPSLPNLSASLSASLPASPTNHQDLLASSVAHFLATRKGLCKQRIGEYLGNLQNSFNQRVLDYFIQEIDLSKMMMDEALRKVCLSALITVPLVTLTFVPIVLCYIYLSP